MLLFECARELLRNISKHAGVLEAEMTLMRVDATDIEPVVRDHGRGFSPIRIGKHQLDELGFGLFNIQERPAHLGGRIDIESTTGQGTQVNLVVPSPKIESTADNADAAPDQSRAAESPSARLRDQPATCRLLIVNDHPIMRQGLISLLKYVADIEAVGEAGDGEKAILAAKKLRPELVLMDVNLGELDGVETTRRLLAEQPDIKVIELSMHLDQSPVAPMIEAGASASLAKSGQSEELISAIRTYCKS